MCKMWLVVVAPLCLLTATDGCWYQSKKPAVQNVERYLRKVGKEPSKGISRAQLESIAENAPSALGWFIKKVDGVEGVLKDCDIDGDGVIHLEEMMHATQCLNSCWKQIGITTFLK